MKKIIAIILVISLCLTCLPNIFVFAEEPKSEEEKIYLSDLFYGYQYYLQNSKILDDYNKGHIDEFERVINRFIDSDEGNKTLYKKAFETMTSPTDFVKLLSDISGRTDFTHQNALNDANAYFAQNVLGAENRESELDEVDSYQDYYDRLEKFSSFSKEFLETHDYKGYSYDVLLNESFALLKKYDIIKNSYIFSVEGNLVSDLDSFNKIAEKTGDAFEAVEVVILSLIIEDVRADRIKLLMNYSNDDILKEGMTKLYGQMKQGFVSYFVENYIGRKMLENIADEVDDFIVDGVLTVVVGGYAGLISALIDVGITVVFDIILQAKDIDDVITQIYLTDYCNCMYDAVMNYSKNFSKQFSPTVVDEYRDLVNLYGIAINATKNYSNDFLIPESGGGHGFAVYPSIEGFADLYSFLVAKTSDEIREIPVENRKMYSYENWIVDENFNYSMGSDELKENTLYFVKGIFKGNISISGKETHFKLLNNVSVVGNVFLCGGEFIIDYFDCASLKIIGNIVIKADDAKLINKNSLVVDGTVKTYDRFVFYPRIVNDSDFEIKGNLTDSNSSCTFTNNGTLKLGGNSNMSLSGGSLVLNGLGLQEIQKINVNNLSVENQDGVKFISDIYVSDKYYLNGNYIDCNGFNAILSSSNAELDSVSNYKNLTVAKDISLIIENTVTIEKFSVSDNCNVTLLDKTNILNDLNINNNAVVNAESDINVSGNINLSGTVSKFIVNEKSNATVMGDIGLNDDANLNNKGNLIVNGNVKTYDRFVFYPRIINDSNLEIKGNLIDSNTSSKFTNNGTLKLGGNSNMSLSGGLLVLNGLGLQEIQKINVNNLSVENQDGVKFISDIYVSDKYYLNGNYIDCNGFNAILSSSNAELDSVSNYKNLTVAKDISLIIENTVTIEKFSVSDNCNVTLLDKTNILNDLNINNNAVVNAESDINVSGNINLSGTVSKFIVNEKSNATVMGDIGLNDDANLNNKGNLIVNGNVKTYDRFVFYPRIINDSNLEIKGNLIDSNTSSKFTNNGTLKLGGHSNMSLSGGLLVLNGLGLQEIQKINVNNLIIENSNGINFNSAITVKVLFDHKRNKFVLYNSGSGSSFVDYDGDSKNDNIDIDPVNYTYFYDYESVCDVDKNKSTNVLDLVRIKKIISGALNEDIEDIITDGKTDAQDMLVVKKYLLSDYSFFDTLNS